jgi:hypothetical protein
MNLRIKNSVICLFIMQIGCSKLDNREGVSNSKIIIHHCDIETSHKIKSFYHTLYIGNYIVKNKKDSLYLLNVSMRYVDSVHYSIPVKGIVFVNNIDNFPKALDDQHSDELREKYIFSVDFNEDSLIRKKYYISSYETWKDGRPILLP